MAVAAAAATGSARRRREQRQRATARHVEWLVGLRQAASHHSLRPEERRADAAEVPAWRQLDAKLTWLGQEVSQQGGKLAAAIGCIVQAAERRLEQKIESCTQAVSAAASATPSEAWKAKDQGKKDIHAANDEGEDTDKFAFNNVKGKMESEALQAADPFVDAPQAHHVGKVVEVPQAHVQERVVELPREQDQAIARHMPKHEVQLVNDGGLRAGPSWATVLGDGRNLRSEGAFKKPAIVADKIAATQANDNLDDAAEVHDKDLDDEAKANIQDEDPYQEVVKAKIQEKCGEEILKAKIQEQSDHVDTMTDNVKANITFFEGARAAGADLEAERRRRRLERFAGGPAERQLPSTERFVEAPQDEARLRRLSIYGR